MSTLNCRFAISRQLSGGNLADSDLLIAESNFMRDFILNITLVLFTHPGNNKNY